MAITSATIAKRTFDSLRGHVRFGRRQSMELADAANEYSWSLGRGGGDSNSQSAPKRTLHILILSPSDRDRICFPKGWVAVLSKVARVGLQGSPLPRAAAPDVAGLSYWDEGFGQEK